MPKFSEKSYIERVVITFHEDGSFRGAHSESHEITLKDGEEISRQSSLTPLDATALGTVLPDAASALAQLAAATDEIEKLQQTVSDLDDERDQLKIAVDGHEATISDLQEKLDALELAI